MKKIILTQRIQKIPDYNESRDAIDQRWSKLLISCGLLPIYVSNNQRHVDAIFNYEDIDGVILTGGGSLEKYGGEFPERDHVEKNIIEWAINHKKTVLGVCRGMQVIQDYFGVTINLIENHVGVRHKLNVNRGLKLSKYIEKFHDVNSYHNFGAAKSNNLLLTLASSEDGVVMAVEHAEKDIYGIMWHPERESPFKEADKILLNHLFK